MRILVLLQPHGFLCRSTWLRGQGITPRDKEDPYERYGTGSIIGEDFDMEDEIVLEDKICLFFELIAPLW